MGGIIGGIGGLASSSGIASGASDDVKDYVKQGLTFTNPWTSQSQTTNDAVNSALGINGKTGQTSNLPEYAQLGANRIASTDNSYDANTIGKTYQSSPGYDWQVEQSNKAIENKARGSPPTESTRWVSRRASTAS